MAWFRRGHSEPESSAEPDSSSGPAADDADVIRPERQPTGDWMTMAPLTPTVGPMAPSFRVQTLPEILPSHHNVRLSGSLGHRVSADAPSGSVAGLAVSTGSVSATVGHDDLPLHEPHHAHEPEPFGRDDDEGGVRPLPTVLDPEPLPLARLPEPAVSRALADPMPLAAPSPGPASPGSPTSAPLPIARVVDAAPPSVSPLSTAEPTAPAQSEAPLAGDSRVGGFGASLDDDGPDIAANADHAELFTAPPDDLAAPILPRVRRGGAQELPSIQRHEDTAETLAPLQRVAEDAGAIGTAGEPVREKIGPSVDSLPLAPPPETGPALAPPAAPVQRQADAPAGSAAPARPVSAPTEPETPGAAEGGPLAQPVIQRRADTNSSSTPPASAQIRGPEHAPVAESGGAPAEAPTLTGAPLGGGPADDAGASAGTGEVAPAAPPLDLPLVDSSPAAGTGGVDESIGDALEVQRKVDGGDGSGGGRGSGGSDSAAPSGPADGASDIGVPAADTVDAPTAGLDEPLATPVSALGSIDGGDAGFAVADHRALDLPLAAPVPAGDGAGSADRPAFSTADGSASVAAAGEDGSGNDTAPLVGDAAPVAAEAEAAATAPLVGEAGPVMPLVGAGSAGGGFDLQRRAEGSGGGGPASPRQFGSAGRDWAPSPTGGGLPLQDLHIQRRLDSVGGAPSASTATTSSPAPTLGLPLAARLTGPTAAPPVPRSAFGDDGDDGAGSARAATATSVLDPPMALQTLPAPAATTSTTPGPTPAAGNAKPDMPLHNAAAHVPSAEQLMVSAGLAERGPDGSLLFTNPPTAATDDDGTPVQRELVLQREPDDTDHDSDGGGPGDMSISRLEIGNHRSPKAEPAKGGHGEGTLQDEAQQLADQARRLYPHIRHQLESDIRRQLEARSRAGRYRP